MGLKQDRNQKESHAPPENFTCTNPSSSWINKLDIYDLFYNYFISLSTIGHPYPFPDAIHRLFYSLGCYNQCE